MPDAWHKFSFGFVAPSNFRHNEIQTGIWGHKAAASLRPRASIPLFSIMWLRSDVPFDVTDHPLRVVFVSGWLYDNIQVKAIR